MLRYTALELWRSALLKAQLQNVQTQLNYRQKMALLEELCVDIWSALIEINQNYYIKESYLKLIKSEDNNYYYALPNDFYKEIAVQRKEGSRINPINRENIISRDGGYMLLPTENLIRLHYNLSGGLNNLYLTYIRKPKQLTFPSQPIILREGQSYHINRNNTSLVLIDGEEFDINSKTLTGRMGADYIYGGGELLTEPTAHALAQTGNRYVLNQRVYPDDVTLEEFIEQHHQSSVIVNPLDIWSFRDSYVVKDNEGAYWLNNKKLAGDKILVTDNYIFTLLNNRLYIDDTEGPTEEINISAQNDQSPNIENLIAAVTNPDTGHGIIIKDGADGLYKMIGYCPDTIQDFPHNISWNYAIMSLGIKIARDLDKIPSESLQNSAQIYKQQMLNEATLDITPTTIARNRTIITRSYW